MPRLARAVFPGHPQPCDVSRQQPGPDLFGDEDYALYRYLFDAHCAAAEVESWPRALMPNHVHLALRRPTRTPPPCAGGDASVLCRPYPRPTEARRPFLAGAPRPHGDGRGTSRHLATICRAEPGAPNVIPGRVVMSLEIRDLDASKMQQVFNAIKIEAESIAETRQTPISFEEIDAGSSPAPTDVRMRKIIARSAETLGLSFKFMPSGAFHDAQDMTHVAPTGMIFVPSVGGISHSPKEYTRPEDMANGANVLLKAVLAIDGGIL